MNPMRLNQSWKEHSREGDRPGGDPPYDAEVRARGNASMIRSEQNTRATTASAIAVGARTAGATSALAPRSGVAQHRVES
jgi:hypothetical protein